MLFGSGVVVGVDDDGETISLNDDQQRTVLEALVTEPAAETLEELRTSLAPLPGVVDLLPTSQ